MKNIRAKGQNGERELASWLNSILNRDDLVRNLEQTRSGGGDILGIEGLTVEVKRQETILENTWWKQVCLAADARGDIPVLAYRKNREQWTFVLPAYLLKVGMPGKIKMGETELAHWVRTWSGL